MNLSEQKQRLRTAINERMARLSESERIAESRSLCKQLLKLLPKEPSVIAAYYPIKDEVDIRPAMEEMLKLGHRLFLPYFEEGKLNFRQVLTLEKLPHGPFHIPEPPKEGAALQLSELNIILIPGRGFTKQGARIGRGNGGYDKWLQKLKGVMVRVWGIAFDTQLVSEIPLEPHDQLMDGIITARGFIDTRKTP